MLLISTTPSFQLHTQKSTAEMFVVIRRYSLSSPILIMSGCWCLLSSLDEWKKGAEEKTASLHAPVGICGVCVRVWARDHPATMKPMENTPNKINMTRIRKKERKKKECLSLGSSVCNALCFRCGQAPLLHCLGNLPRNCVCCMYF